MVYLTGPFRDSAGVLGTGYATIEQSISFAQPTGGVVAVAHRAYMKDGELFEDAQYLTRLNVPLPPLEFPIFLTLTMGAESLPRSARRFAEGTRDTDTVSWFSMEEVENAAEPVQWVIPEGLQKVYGSVEEALAAAASAAASAADAEARRLAAAQSAGISDAAAVRADAYADEAARAAANARGRVIIVKPDPYTVDVPTIVDGVEVMVPTPILADGRPYYSNAADSDEPTAPPVDGVVVWGQIREVPAILGQIGTGDFEPVESDDSRLDDARTPVAHTHSVSDVYVGEGVALSDQLATFATIDSVAGKAESTDLDELAATVSGSLDAKADKESPAFTGTPTAPSPNAESAPEVIATAGYVRSLLGGEDGEIPDATATTKGAIMLPGAVPGELGGTYEHPTVNGWDDLLSPEDLAGYARTTDLAEYVTTGAFGQAINTRVPLNADGVIDPEYLVLAPQTPGGGGPGDMGAVRPESFSGTAAERIEKALVSANTQGKSVYISADTTLDRGIVVSDINVNLWGPPGTRLILPKASGSAFSCIHTTRDHFLVKAVRTNTWGWSGSSKPDNSESVRLSEIIPQSQADLSKIVAEDTWRVENKWAGDKYVWSSEVGGTVLKGSHAPVRGVMFNVDMVVGQLFTEGDTVVQKNSAGVQVASGVLKGFQKIAMNASKQTTKGQILFESLTGTFSGAVTGNPGTLLVNGVAIGTIVKDPVSGEYGSVLISGIGIEDTFTNNPSSATPTIVMRRLPKYRFSMVGLSFDVEGNPEDNTTRTDRSTSVMLGNIIAPRLDITVRNAWAAAVTIAGCPNRSFRLHILEGPNDARFQSPTVAGGGPNPDYDPLNDIGAWGYGLVTYGVCDGGYDYLRGGHLRHLFTTNPDERGTHPLDASSTSAFSLAATGTSRDCVTELFAYDCYASAYNSHEGCLRMVLQNFYIQGSMAGGQKDSGDSAVALRSFAHIVRNGIIVGSKAGVKVASNHIPGSPVKNHTIIENVHLYGVQEFAVNTGNKPAESANHKVSILRNRMNDAGFAKSQPWDSSGILLSAVDTDIFDNYIGRFNYSPIRLIGSTPATGVTPKIRIRGNELDYSEVVNSSTNKANGIDLSGTTGYVFETDADNTVNPKGTGAARQPNYVMQNRTGNGLFLWPEGGYIQSSGEAVPVFNKIGGSPTHGSIARAAMPTATSEPPPSGETPTTPPTTPPAGDPNDNTATTPSITPWLGSRYVAVGDSSGILAQSTYSPIISGINYGAEDIWPRLVGLGFDSPPDPSKYPNGINKAVTNWHIGSSTTPDVALRLLRNAPFRNNVRKWVPGSWDLVTMLCGGNDVGHFHASTRGKQTYKDGVSTLAGIFRSREFVYTTAANETGTWTNSSVQYGDRTRLTVTPGSSVKLSWTGKNATLIMLAPEDGSGSSYTTKLDTAAAVTRTTKNHGHDTELSGEAGTKHTPVPIHYRNLTATSHTVTITHTGAQGDPLVVEVLLPWYESPKDMPFVIMVPPGKSTVRGYGLYPDPQPSNTEIIEFRGLMTTALADFSSYGNLVQVAEADIDAAMPYNDYDVRINDGLHPNKQGHKNIANAMLKTLIKYKPSA